MKKHDNQSRNALGLVFACLLLSVVALDLARAADAPARLVIHRIASLGNNLIVHMRIDGGPAVSIAYGHTYATSLSPGRHVIALMSTPNAIWKAPWEMTLDARSDNSYSFTAVGDSSGRLVLKRER